MDDKTKNVASGSWETEPGWEKVVARPVIDYPMAPRDALRVLQAAGEVMANGIDADRVVNAIHSAGVVEGVKVEIQTNAVRTDRVLIDMFNEVCARCGRHYQYCECVDGPRAQMLRLV